MELSGLSLFCKPTHMGVIFLSFIYVCVWVRISAVVCGDIRLPEAGVTGGNELPTVGS